MDNKKAEKKVYILNQKPNGLEPAFPIGFNPKFNINSDLKVDFKTDFKTDFKSDDNSVKIAEYFLKACTIIAAIAGICYMNRK